MKISSISLIGLTFVIAVSYVSACSCVYPSLERDYFQESTQFFVKATPVFQYETSFKRFYTLKIIRQYKSCSKIFRRIVSTPLSSAACGAYLKIGTEYVLPLRKSNIGSLNEISQCDYIREAKSLSKTELRFLESRQSFCKDKIICASGKTQTPCLVEPCSVSKPGCSEAVKCVNNYCGYCLAEWFNKDGLPACKKNPFSS